MKTQAMKIKMRIMTTREKTQETYAKMLTVKMETLVQMIGAEVAPVFTRN
tara:strand:+ start:294 stop:443 length:150 start_codon:yes stop_codon:yes gene_type:complete